jgi:hypothetical protein
MNVLNQNKIKPFGKKFNKNNNYQLALRPTSECLFTLPEGILMDILTRWIHIKDLVTLDSAILNKRMRYFFLFMLRKKEAIFNINKKLKTCRTHLIWLSSRGIAINHLNLTFQDRRIIPNFQLIIQNCSNNLESINLSSCATAIFDSSLSIIAKYCKNIKSINLSGCKHITDKGLIELLQASKNLEELDLNECTKITESSITEIGYNCPNLRSFRFHSVANGELKTSSLISVAANCHSLTHWNLSGVGDNDGELEGVLLIVKRCKGLQTLRIPTTYNEDFIDEIRDSWSNITCKKCKLKSLVKGNIFMYLYCPKCNE